MRYTLWMAARHIIRRARLRAGLTQSEVAARLKTTQSAVARWEAGGTSPSYDAVARVVEACGFGLESRIVEADTAEWTLAQLSLRLTPEQRFDQLVRTVAFADAGRSALGVRGEDG
ncbi:MAG: helix-turn-helix domain-containing protein [Acidobacteria bacterium]|nr:helix-turn-helix domain-containing protein [Acidobacteriota bacterium]